MVADNILTIEDLKQCLFNALSNNSLLSDKHDPNKMGVVWPDKRSVISHQVAADLFQFIDVGIERIFEYQNGGGNYYEIALKSNYKFAASGVAELAVLPHQGFDRIIAVYGKRQHWHIYGEDSKVIAKNYATGKLQNKTELL
ncbi:MAG TPA: hypothetical protein VI757_10110 [Bacteroidia bacterium]|nr:hypothetical protein [Bacteroidia bacterium]